VCVYVYIDVGMRISFLCKSIVYIYGRMYRYMYIHTYLKMYVYIYIYVYINMYIHMCYRFTYLYFRIPMLTYIGGLYRIMIDQDDVLMRNLSPNLKKNEYTLNHFPLVLRELKKRKLDLLINIPPFMDKKLILSADWIDYDLIYQTRNKMGSLFPGVLGVGR
jgi:hypothetical protein